ncbi:MTH1187 family thiamine-binding protein [Ammonifex thiophilus]|uniref:Thiamine-binding protein n=1 Tax=Ammonifex thiophilus TaxID=444093 RepID=A0A3D8P5D5_9THEO|nr:MTH1187 family thiamine-binding protein [Ammonifex thiophilus]RDV82890.1 thiamine-binding protein [Ammonifex thiophilus]
MVVAEISVVPLGTGSPSVGRYVAECVKIVQESGLKHEITAMGTLVEGELEEILELVRKMHLAPFAAGVQRVVTTVKIDERRDKELSLEGKVAAVKRELGES